MCVRYVLDNHPIERFYTSCELPQQDAKTIAKTYLIPIIKQISTSSVLVGFGSDGASVMSGEHGGVLKHLKDIFPEILYVHCYCHRLNLVLSKFVKVNSAACSVFELYGTLHKVLAIAKNRAIFENSQKDKYPKSQLRSVSHLAETRWCCNFDGVDMIISRYTAILDCLNQISEDKKSPTSSVAYGLAIRLQSPETIVILCFLHKLLSITQGLNLLLQAKKINYVQAASEVEVIGKILITMNVTDFYTYAEEISRDLDIDLEEQVQKRNRASKSAKQILENLVRDSVSYIIKELNLRFSTEVANALLSLSALDAASDNYLDYKTINPLASRFSNSLEINCTLLQAEMERAKICVSDGKNLLWSSYPNLHKMFSLMHTIPVTSAENERSFSAFGRIMTDTRSSLTSKRASELVFLAMNKDMFKNISIANVLNRWVKMANRIVSI